MSPEPGIQARDCDLGLRLRFELRSLGGTEKKEEEEKKEEGGFERSAGPEGTNDLCLVSFEALTGCAKLSGLAP